MTRIIMFLKNYQIKVVNTLQQFFRYARETRTEFETAQKYLPDQSKGAIGNWVENTFRKQSRGYVDRTFTGLGNPYPRIVMKVPTGGGKTLLAVEAIREYQNLFARKRTGLVVWIVPTETIYSQTVKRLRDKANPLRQLLDQCSGNKTLILEKGQRLAMQEIEENLVILFVMIQSISRVTGKEALKVFQDSGGYESFFPADNRNDLHEELLKRFPNLDRLSSEDSIFPLIKTSLGNAIRVSSPFIIIDEIHKVFSDTARNTIDQLNPEMVLGLSATPKKDMNVIVSITGLELKEEEMVKLDMHIIPPVSRRENDWKSMVREIKERRESLEKKAAAFRRASGVHIRPMALVQVEATGKDQRGKDRVHSLDVKDYLIQLEVNPDEVAIKTSSQNDIEDVDLFDAECPVRYIITKEALREGWDCSFAYLLGVIPNVGSDTGITQLVGRILRQPNARKTGIKELDESYVYYSRGQTREMLDKVVVGFRNEGLEDLIAGVKISGDERIHASKTVKIRKEFKKYSSAFYLPVWVMIESGDKKRKFLYENDIKPFLKFDRFATSSEHFSRILNSLSEENRNRHPFAITLDESSKTVFREETLRSSDDAQISIEYMTRRFAEIIENPFLARKCAIRSLDAVRSKMGADKLRDHFGFIVSMLVQFLHDEKSRQEEEIFLEYLRGNRIVLAVSNNESLGYRIPQSEEITVGGLPVPYRCYLFEDVDITAMNRLEQKVGDLIDKQQKILWWFRNKGRKPWYAIQGWQQYRIRPDFIAARKNDSGKLELVYILESKGEHLLGNADTEYKKKMLDLISEQSQSKKIHTYQQTELQLTTVNDNIEAYLIEENQEDEEVRRLFK
jgi:type III restriction enzyme